jgi:hypothetical protein
LIHARISVTDGSEVGLELVVEPSGELGGSDALLAVSSAPLSEEVDRITAELVVQPQVEADATPARIVCASEDDDLLEERAEELVLVGGGEISSCAHALDDRPTEALDVAHDLGLGERFGRRAGVVDPPDHEKGGAHGSQADQSPTSSPVYSERGAAPRKAYHSGCALPYDAPSVP